MFSIGFVSLSLSLLALFLSIFFPSLEYSSRANQTSAPNAHSTNSKREGGKEGKHKRVKERKACKIGQKEKKRREKELGNNMDRQAGLKDCFFSVS